MRNKVEILRALVRIEDDMDRLDIPKSWDVKDVDVEFIVEFKKVYEMGITKLKEFLEKLESDGKDLDEFTIKYYMDNLQSGPFGKLLADLTTDSKYFKPASVLLGSVTRTPRTQSNTEPVLNSPQLSPTHPDMFRMMTVPVYDMVVNAEEMVSDVHKRSILSKVGYDNTLNEVDKNPRYNKIEGELNDEAHGSYSVTDVSYYKNVSSAIVDDILDIVKSYLGDEAYRLYLDDRIYNPYDEEHNTSTSVVSMGIKVLKESENYLEYSILRFLKDNLDRRSFKLTIETEEENKEYLIHTTDGALDV
jgi:hypothetical protein